MPSAARITGGSELARRRRCSDQEPSFVSEAIAPKRSLILGLGLLVAVLSGVATIAGCAYLQRSPLSLGDLSQRLRLPLVASFSPGLRTAAL